MPLAGIRGRPWIDLTDVLDAYAPISELEAVHDEVCLALTRVRTTYTGGSHRSLGIQPPSALDDRPDYGEVIARMTDREFLVLASLSDPSAPWDPARRDLVFGEDGDVPLSDAQMRWLELRWGVYFPWKVYLELMPGGRWSDKSDPRGKRFTREAMLHFPRTIAYVRRLPFEHVGSVKLMGLAANDDGTIHRDGDPAEQEHPDHFVILCPSASGAPDKRLFLWDEEAGVATFVRSRAYWFNDHDWHGVAADPVFRYSIRVDGRFLPEVAARLEVA